MRSSVGLGMDQREIKRRERKLREGRKEKKFKKEVGLSSKGKGKDKNDFA